MAKRTIKIIAGVVGVGVGLLVLLGGALAVFLWAFGNMMCGGDVLQEANSPNGERKAVVYQYDCGATTGFGTHIAILDANDDIGDRGGNVFRASGHPDWFNFKLRWEDDTNLTIEHNGKPIPIKAETDYRGIAIRYVENREGILPPRSFMPDELLLPVSYFPTGWTAREMRPLGPEEIKGSHDNHPYMFYDSPLGLVAAGLYVSRSDNVEEALQQFQWERDALLDRYSEHCAPPGSPLSEALIVASRYTDNFYVGYAEHEYSDGSGEPACRMLAQYDEFFIWFRATIGDGNLTYQQFNDLARIIDENASRHLEQDNTQ